MHPPPAHGFPRLVRKKSDWGAWVVSPVWIVMEPTAKRPLNGALAVSPRGFTDTRTRDFTGMVGRDLDTLLCPFGLYHRSRRVGCVPTRFKPRKPRFASPPNDDTHQNPDCRESNDDGECVFAGKPRIFVMTQS